MFFKCKKEEPVLNKTFKFLDTVKVTRGFYEGLVGTVQSIAHAIPNSYGIVTSYVNTSGETNSLYVVIPASDLELIQ